MYRPTQMEKFTRYETTFKEHTKKLNQLNEIKEAIFQKVNKDIINCYPDNWLEVLICNPFMANSKNHKFKIVNNKRMADMKVYPNNEVYNYNIKLLKENFSNHETLYPVSYIGSEIKIMY